MAPSVIDTTVPNLDLNITRNGHGFDYEAGETAGHSHADQRDIIVAASTLNLSDINHVGDPRPEWPYYTDWMTVSLKFRHALSQVMFDARLLAGYPELKVVIKSITICNVSRKGTCTIGSTDGTPMWSNQQPTIRDAYTVMTGGTDGITLYTTDGKTGAAVDLVPLSNGSSDNNADNLMLIPQQLTAWNPGTEDAPVAPEGESQTGSYLKINCEITQRGYNLLRESCVYVPFGTGATTHDTWDGEWQAGKSYTCHLLFGLGYDSHGRANGAAITYSVSVADSWTTSIKQGLNL